MYSRTAARSLSQSARAARSQAARRHLSTAPPAAQPANSSHLVSGLAGGGLVLGVLYGYYHYSGTAKVVSTSRQAIDAAKSAKDKVASSTPSPKEALGLVRSIAKSYAAAIPGAAGAVDASFDQLEQLAEKHGDKVSEVVKQTYDDVVKASEGGKDAGEKIVKALAEAVGKVQKLVGEEGGKAFDLLKEKFPEVGKALGGEFEELQKLSEKHGPEASRIASSFYDDASKIVSEGGVNAKTLESVKDLLAKKTKEIKDFSQKAGKDAWEASAKKAGPLLDKMPDVKKLVDENVGKLEGVVGEDRVKVVKDLYAELEKIGKSGKSVDDMTKEAKKLVEEKVGSLDELKKKASDAGSEAASSAAKYAGAIPGLGELSKALEGTDLKVFKELAEKHGEKGQEILNSTYDEIKQILQKKAEEAKKVAGDAKDDAKKEAKK
ncbi:hypothetical protein BCR35DRAFT_309715 [Leucosporidium creatinivorum]|uniref:Uncharacterized protein n=1 Tax=Leucosporidium creatinivorum TaxID=106004 RepID=A0A1Y2DCY3_9BASI|nr:hypothetical protein BCR35DRAFT_309715 [Leucosporidium creatinivorum]